MLEKALDLVAPHYCCSCGEIGSILCESCKYDITSERFNGCLLCGESTLMGNCCSCSPDIARTWCGGERLGGLEALINSYKFEYAVAAATPLSDIVLAALPDLPEDTVVVPIPTVRAHIRQRGYDHTLLIARQVATKRGLRCESVLARVGSSVQRGADRKTRIRQAKTAFEVHKTVQNATPYLLIDDVVTTGSTLRYAARALKDAGADTVWAVAVARQPLD